MPRDVGVQSYTYRTFSTAATAAELADVGVSAVELCGVHVDADAGESEVAGCRETFAERGIEVCGYGVAGFEDPESVEATFALADRLGAAYVSADLPPDDGRVVAAVLEAAADHDLDLAIHNHGPGHRYATAADVRAVLDAHPDPRLGACVDTGHFLRAGETVGDVFPALGDRVHAIHLKDFADGEEVVPGDGALDVGAVLAALDEVGFDRPLVLEYEADPDDPTPAVRETVARIEGAR